jgi:hypothetical protein
MLTPDQVTSFEHNGLLPLSKAVPPDRIGGMRDAIWEFLATRHIRQRDNPETWTRIDRRPGFQALTRSGAFDALGVYVTLYVDALLGKHSWKVPTHWGHPLITFPNPGTPWQIPASGWHVDAHRWSSGAVPGVVAFTFVEQVQPRGGGTLVLSGSHHLTWELCKRSGGFAKTSQMKTALADADPWFADLWAGPTGDPHRLARYMRQGVAIDGIDVRLVELCGEPGDIVLMNARSLHAPAPNANASPRLMLSDFLDRVRQPA